MTAVNYDMIAVGAIDKDLTGTPQMTFWRSTYKAHTKFAIESVSQPFSTTVNFGGESQIVINRMGDLIYNNYLHVTIPGLLATDISSEPTPAGFVAATSSPRQRT